MEEGTLIEQYWQTCPLCGKRLHKSNGRYNHMMFHVRRGEATRENDPLTDMRFGLHFPYRFRRAALAAVAREER